MIYQICNVLKLGYQWSSLDTSVIYLEILFSVHTIFSNSRMNLTFHQHLQIQKVQKMRPRSLWKEKKSFKNNVSFFKTMCFISDLYLHIFWNLGWIWWWCWWNFDFKFLYIFFTYFPPALKDPKSPSPTFAFALKFRGYVDLYTSI